MRALATSLIRLLLALLLAGCHHAVRGEPEAPLVTFDAEVFPVVAKWVGARHATGRLVFDPRPSDKWVARFSPLAALPRSSVAAMQARRLAALRELGYAGRIEKDLEKDCASRLLPSSSSSQSREMRRGCPADDFTYVVVTVPSHGPGAQTEGGTARVVFPDSAFVSLSAEEIGPGGWALYEHDLVLGRSASGWKVVRVAMSSIVE